MGENGVGHSLWKFLIIGGVFAVFTAAVTLAAVTSSWFGSFAFLLFGVLQYAKRLLVAEEGGNVLRRPPIRVHFVDVHSDHVNEVAHHVHLVLLDGL